MINHEESVVQLAKGLTVIAEALPRTELKGLLYPTANMKRSIELLYAHIIKFLIRAMKSYAQPGWKHAVTSITRPFALHFKDILDDIMECSRRIDQLAIAWAQAEQRDMHSLLQSMTEMMSSKTTSL